MPFKDPEKKKQYARQLYHKNREKKLDRSRKYYQENKENKRLYDTEYQQENPHIKKITAWKGLGIKLRPNEDWESVYLFYITCEECESCGIELIGGRSSNSRNLDHDHSTGFIRNILCKSCNVKRR